MPQQDPSQILVIGDVMIDEAVFVEPTRIAAEAPIPVYQRQSVTRSLGGAANVAANVAALHGRCDLFTVMSDETHRSDLVALCGHHAIDIYSVGSERRFAGPTVKRRIWSGTRLLTREDNDQPHAPASAADYLTRLKAVLNANSYKIVLISDYAKGALGTRHSLLSEVIKYANAAGAKVIVDPRPVHFSYLRGAFVITPNETELAQISGLEVDEIENGSESLVDLGLDGIVSNVVCTNGRNGAILFDQAGVSRFPTRVSHVYDVCGAGDTFTATLAVELISHDNLPLAIQIANLAAGTVVTKPGTSVVDPLELRLAKAAAIHPYFKIVSAEVAALACAQWQAAGEKVVFSNGCFDMLHPGHVHVLVEARRRGTRLIGAVNTDSSVSASKGPNRPKTKQGDRAEMVAALGCVDLVVVFNEQTPSELIRLIRPDVLVRVADDIDLPGGAVGSDLVKETYYVPRLPEYSTTQILKALGCENP
jgi:D-beta-D-heptose 7-phosphate kinase/D-beta-D-heptose 1-phosphate adenosyltransferase